VNGTRIGRDTISQWWLSSEGGATRLLRVFEDICGVPELVDEAREVSGPLHPNVWGVRSWASDRCEMDPVAGWTLDEIGAEGPLDPLAAIAVALDLCDAAAAGRALTFQLGRGPDPSFTVVTPEAVARAEAPALARMRYSVVLT
jgi:hypothetical protein